jgi:organic radical activating enzyme
VPATSPIEASLIEVFSSIQGEGVLIGCRQVFVRFAGCNLSCAYCDTPFHAGPVYRQEIEPGSGRTMLLGNPVDLHSLTKTLEKWQSRYPHLHHSICLTGGEPLLHADALAEWLPIISTDWRVYLETNGTLPAEARKVLPWVTWVSMDLKTSETTGQPTDWDAHAEFIRAARGRLCHVKLVVGEQTGTDDVRLAAAFVSDHAVEAPLILQPRMQAGRLAVEGPRLLDLQAAAATEYADSRLIPQVHPFLGIA